MKFNADQHYWANIFVTDEFICITTYSGLGRTGIDPLFPSHLLLPDADDSHIGEVILQALSDSRTLTSLKEREELFDLERGQQIYRTWYCSLMEKYGYKTKRALFKNMKKCGVHLINGQITISPSNHETLESWTGKPLEESDDVFLSLRNSSAEIGAGFRLALSRCT